MIRSLAWLALAIATPTLAADGPALKTVAEAKLGRWSLRDLDGSAPARTICIARAEQFVYLGRGSIDCTRRVLADAPPHASVQFRCDGRGYGRTGITAETPELLTIDAQGMFGGVPFDERLEARWLGACPSR